MGTALRVSLSRHNGQKGVVSYSNFKIAAERQKYQLQSADGFKDDECGQKVGNSLAGMNFGKQGYGHKDIAKTVHVGMKFSTPDQDNDLNKRANCAQQDRSGWWFNSCSAANLNGYYHGGKYTPEQTRTGEFDDGVLWNSWTNDKFEALAKTRDSAPERVVDLAKEATSHMALLLPHLQPAVTMITMIIMEITTTTRSCPYHEINFFTK